MFIKYWAGLHPEQEQRELREGAAALLQVAMAGEARVQPGGRSLLEAGPVNVNDADEEMEENGEQ